jgi:hypothetical protein
MPTVEIDVRDVIALRLAWPMNQLAALNLAGGSSWQRLALPGPALCARATSECDNVLIRKKCIPHHHGVYLTWHLRYA